MANDNLKRPSILALFPLVAVSLVGCAGQPAALQLQASKSQPAVDQANHSALPATIKPVTTSAIGDAPQTPQNLATELANTQDQLANAQAQLRDARLSVQHADAKVNVLTGALHDAGTKGDKQAAKLAAAKAAARDSAAEAQQAEDAKQAALGEANRLDGEKAAALQHAADLQARLDALKTAPTNTITTSQAPAAAPATLTITNKQYETALHKARQQNRHNVHRLLAAIAAMVALEAARLFAIKRRKNSGPTPPSAYAPPILPPVPPTPPALPAGAPRVPLMRASMRDRLLSPSSPLMQQLNLLLAMGATQIGKLRGLGRLSFFKSRQDDVARQGAKRILKEHINAQVPRSASVSRRRDRTQGAPKEISTIARQSITDYLNANKDHRVATRKPWRAKTPSHVAIADHKGSPVGVFQAEQLALYQSAENLTAETVKMIFAAYGPDISMTGNTEFRTKFLALTTELAQRGELRFQGNAINPADILVDSMKLDGTLMTLPAPAPLPTAADATIASFGATSDTPAASSFAHTGQAGIAVMAAVSAALARPISGLAANLPQPQQDEGVSVETSAPTDPNVAPPPTLPSLPAATGQKTKALAAPVAVFENERPQYVATFEMPRPLKMTPIEYGHLRGYRLAQLETTPIKRVGMPDHTLAEQLGRNVATGGLAANIWAHEIPAITTAANIWARQIAAITTAAHDVPSAELPKAKVPKWLANQIAGDAAQQKRRSSFAASKPPAFKGLKEQLQALRPV